MSDIVSIRISPELRLRIERWRALQMGRVDRMPSFSDAARQLLEQSLNSDGVALEKDDAIGFIKPEG